MTTELFANVPLSPPPPKDLYFSDDQKAWILSRHRDVQAALRSSDLSQSGPPKSAAGSGIKPGREKMDPEIFNALLNTYTAKWRTEITGLASALLQPLFIDRPVDLAAEFIRPWCLASAIALTGLDPAHSDRLADLVSCLSASDAAPQDTLSRSKAKEASQELDHFCRWPSAPYGKSLFLGIAQTVPAFLASAWAALLQDPSGWKALRTHPEWIPKATEELLRYAGPVHTLFRHADQETYISGKKIAPGDRLILRIASANRDPHQFVQPDHLDIKRSAAGHLALSSGSHYCFGASLVRMMTIAATEAITGRYSNPQFSNPVTWSCGTMLIWPSSLPVLLGGSDRHVPIRHA